MRKRLTLLGVVALALACWMLFGRAGLGRTESGEHDPRRRGDEGSLQLASTEGDGAADPAVAGDAIEVPDDPSMRALADRWSGHVHRLRDAVDAGRLGAACAEMDAIAALTLPETWTGQRERVAQELTVALAEFGLRLREAIRTARILEARASVAAARAQPHPRVETLLRALAADFELPVLPAAAAGTPITTAEPAAPAAEGRLVRLRFRDGWHSGRVVGVSGDHFTVKVETADGVYFPVKTRGELEPVEPSLAEAMQRIALAAGAGDRLGAALWLCHVQGRADKDAAAVEAWRSRLL